ncbi:MAG: peptide deformylase, partial [Oscillospiraceae bacterium]|nr:peptide deformylase [Oscillospiraceae bacterium]
MVRDIIKDIIFLSQKSVPVETEDLFIVQDLRDTLSANRESCVGMAANMIGYRKNIIVVTVGSTDLILLNPVIVKKAIPYTTVEGCLSLEGQHKTTRFRKIVVR